MKKEIMNESATLTQQTTGLEALEKDAKSTTEALRFSAAAFRSIHESIIATDTEYKITHWNQISERMYGIRANEAIGIRLFDVIEIVEASPGENARRFAKLETQGYYHEEQLHRTRCTELWVNVGVQAIEDDGKRYGWVALAEDITERKRLGQALSESERKYRDLVDSLPQTIFEIDEKGNLTYANRHGFQLSGYSLEDIGKGLNALQLFIPEDRERVKENIRRIMAGEKISGQEYTALIKDGSTFPVMIYSSLIVRESKPIGLRGIVIDMTDLKQAEEALRQSEERYKALFEQKLDGVVVIDEKLKLLLANKAAAEMFDFDSVEELLEINLFEYIASEERERTFEIIAKDMFEKDLRQINEFRCIKKSGEEIWIGAIGTRIEYQGRVVGLASFRDITLQKQTEQELERSHQELRKLSSYLQSVREEERTLIAHEIHDELGQSLTALKMDIFWLQKRLTKEQQPLLDKAETMSKLVDDTILSVKRISSKLRPTILDDLGLVAAIEWQAEEFKDHTGVNCEVSIGTEDLVLGKERATTIFRVFQEALTNITRHAHATNVKVSLKLKAKRLVLKVVDNGEGITDEQILSPKSFGLIGMRERAHYFGGEVKINGIAGKGTTLEITIPLTEVRMT
jgi:PAS domain S-box-containing protein